MSKFGNIKTGRHSSKKEATRAQELHLMQRGGLISKLREQVIYEVIPKQVGERAAHYVADFVYIEDGMEITEDCKGFRTREYILKRKLMKLVHGITILET